jgi:hypothetical protein
MVDLIKGKTMFRNFLAVVIFASMTAGVSAAKAADVHDYHNAVSDAYDHYKEASFYLRTGNPMVASIGLQDMADKWETITKRFGNSPPGIYTNDKAWNESLIDIDQRIKNSLKAIDDGDLKAAQKQIAPIRKILSAQRALNDVFLFSDRVDRANDAMDAIWKFRHNPPDFSSIEQVNDLRQKTTLMTYWYERCRDTATETVKNDPQFKRLVDQTLYSLGRMWLAIEEKNQRRVINILREMRSSDRLLYLHFG